MLLQPSCVKFVSMGVVRKSKSIVVLLEVFNKSNNAISVVELIKNTSTQINKSTVYRALERMEQKGIIHSFNDKNGCFGMQNVIIVLQTIM